MSKKSEIERAKDTTELSKVVGMKAALKLKARRNAGNGVWFGLGMLGLIGWSVVVPTLSGVAFGIWLDNRHPGRHSWTLMLMAIGLVIGCLNAWHWIAKEDQEMQEEQAD